MHDWTRSAVCKWWKETQGVTLHLSTSTGMLTTTESTHAVGHTAFNANGINQVCVVLGVFAVLFIYEQDVSWWYVYNVYIREPKYLSNCFLVDSD